MPRQVNIITNSFLLISLNRFCNFIPKEKHSLNCTPNMKWYNSICINLIDFKRILEFKAHLYNVKCLPQCTKYDEEISIFLFIKKVLLRFLTVSMRHTTHVMDFFLRFPFVSFMSRAIQCYKWKTRKLLTCKVLFPNQTFDWIVIFRDWIITLH